ncbi:hypothetical protein ABZ864_47895 [Streptomyces sp. NPDC047082]|uniref:hypothetical protein n=1 Tax=Streptomyces sp. NPDC047082 TaxID=3155259 RepID=UPI0033CD40AF
MTAGEHQLRGFEACRVAQLLDGLGRPGELDRRSWARVSESLQARGRDVIPGRSPAGPDELVLLYPVDGVIGGALHAAWMLCETGSRAAAEELAQACRSLAALASIPSRRLHQAVPVPADPTARMRLDHQVAQHGNGYLAMLARDAVNALERGQSLRTRDGVFPLPRYPVQDDSWVVVRHSSHSAVGILLTSVEQVRESPDTAGIQLLWHALHSVAAALRPGPASLERPTDH